MEVIGLGRNTLDLAAAPLNETSVTGVAAPPPPPSHAYDALADARAWYVGVEGRFFYDRRVRGGGIAAGGLLEPPVADGPLTVTHAPIDGGFSVRANRSSPFSAVAAFDFAYEDFAAIPASGCGDAGGVRPERRRQRVDRRRRRQRDLLLGGGGAPMDAGAIWQREALPLAAGFESDFTFRVSGRTLCAEAPRAPPPGQGASGAGGGDGSAACDESALIGGTGFGFVIHSHVERSASLGCAGSGLGIRRATPDEAGEGGGGDAQAAGIGGGSGACAECVAPPLCFDSTRTPTSTGTTSGAPRCGAITTSYGSSRTTAARARRRRRRSRSCL